MLSGQSSLLVGSLGLLSTLGTASEPSPSSPPTDARSSTAGPATSTTVDELVPTTPVPNPDATSSFGADPNSTSLLSTTIPSLPPTNYNAFVQGVVSDAINNYTSDQATNDIAAAANAFAAQQAQLAAVQQQQISELQKYADKLGWTLRDLSIAAQAAQRAAESANEAWFWGDSKMKAAVAQIAQAQAAQTQLDAQVEQFRQYLLANPSYAQQVVPQISGTSDLVSTLSSQSSLSGALKGKADYWAPLLYDQSLQSCADPVSVATVTIMTAGVGSPLVAGTSSSMAGSAGAGITTSIIGGEARPIISQYVAGLGVDATGGLITDSTLAPMATSTLGAGSTSLGLLTRSLATTSPYILDGLAPSAITNPSRLLSPTNISNPWMADQPIVSMPAPAGTQIDMAMAPGQTVPGGWGTPNIIPDVNYVRGPLAVTPEFKPEIGFVQRYEIPQGVQIQYGTAGPQTYNGVTYPGGAPQIQILNYADRAGLVPVGSPVPIH